MLLFFYSINMDLKVSPLKYGEKWKLYNENFLTLTFPSGEFYPLNKDILYMDIK